MRLGFAIDNRACIGCHACTVACKAEHSVPIGVNRTWVKYIEKGEFPNTGRAFQVQRCNHCDDAPCVEICPVTSLYRRPDGIVDFDNERCIGCKACMQACPYDALYLDPETETAAKCNYCTHRIDVGLLPACVVVCPVEAIVSGDLDDPNSRISRLDQRLAVQYPKVEKGTEPKLFYIGGESAALDSLAAPPTDQYLWSSTPKAALAAAEDEANEEARARRVYDPPRKPTPWGMLVSAYVTTKAISAGTAIVAFLAYAFGDASSALPLSAAAASLTFLAITGVLLVADLKQPKRFLYVLLRPQWRSWLVRGSYIITAFGLLVPLLAYAAWSGAPRWLLGALGGLTAAGGAATAAYTAFLFAQAKGRDYWQDPLLAIEMLADALAAGLATLIVLEAAGQSIGIRATNNWMLLAIVVLGLLQSAALAMRHPSKGAAAAVKMIVSGRYSGLFWGGVVGAGLALPALLTLLGAALPLAAVLVVAGIAIKSHLLVQAPQQVPLS